jgi:hypothetical protein
MSKSLLFVCLVLVGVTAVLCNTQLRFLNNQIGSINTYALATSLTELGNTTLFKGVPSSLAAAGSAQTIPAIDYIDLPAYQYPVGEEISLWGITNEPFVRGSFIIETDVKTEALNVTLEENQSYSAVFVASTDEDYGGFVNDYPPRTDFSTPMLFLYEERPNPSPFGKALLKIVNVAVVTFGGESMALTINGTDVESKQISLDFGQASQFIEYDTATNVVIYTTLPAVYENVDEYTTYSGFIDRTFDITLAVNKTTVVYIRGDLAGFLFQRGDLVEQVDFAFPPAPEPPMDAPVDAPAEPMAEEPVATPTAAIPVRAPITKVSSAAQTAAQIIGMAGMALLLF